MKDIEIDPFIKQTRISTCGRYNCMHNNDHECNLKIVSLDSEGICQGYIVQNAKIYLPKDNQ